MVKQIANVKLKLVTAAVLALTTVSNVNAAGFSLYGESTASAVGNYAAGIAAEAADASTGWYNPAGLALIHEQQLVVGGVGLFLSSDLSGTGTFQSLAPFPPPFVSHETFTNLDGAEDGFVPSFHYARPINEKWTFGLSVVSPFGLVTKWPEHSAVRYQATNSELFTVTASPELGYRVNEHFALGAGLDLTYAKVRFNSIAGIPTLALTFHQAPDFFDSFSYNKGHAYGVGFHAGAMLMFNEDHSRIGLNFQSNDNLKFHGNSRLTGRLAQPGLNLLNPFSVLTASPNSVFSTDDLSSEPVDLPYIITLSAYHELNERLALLGSVVYTGWDSFGSLQLNNVAGFSSTLGQVPVDVYSAENWKNVWRVALGANYHWSEELMLRFGVGYDQTPTTDTRRSVRIPDSSRYAVAIGARYAVRNDIDLDVGYSHYFATGDVQINRSDFTSPTTVFNVNATGQVKADIIGAQVTWYFDGKEVLAPMKA